jgi:hypothetical protein
VGKVVYSVSEEMHTREGFSFNLNQSHREIVKTSLCQYDQEALARQIAEGIPDLVRGTFDSGTMPTAIC